MTDLLDELKWRGLFHQATDESALREHLAQTRTIDAGFDPTADSLTVGNLVPIMLLKHFQRAELAIPRVPRRLRLLLLGSVLVNSLPLYGWMELLSNRR